ncbi:hypothetical protein IAQ61_001807 [Plenodomus lingam]|uniref:uncharacterized protein n=1 Tax=Leptosphaeria maculans TaxID=5022 RepID=UPI00331D455B|nr:hypothetical protein IAQ61_001807 [Plenodomus lingam]
MQGYGQASEQQRPSSVASFTGQASVAPPLPPRTYAASPAYQSPTPHAQSGSWAPPPPPASNSWAPQQQQQQQQQHVAGGYNTGTYGDVGQAASAPQPSYPPQLEPPPPPPPPKPQGFAAAVHRQQQQYEQQQQQYQQHQQQHIPAFTPQTQQGDYAAPGASQQYGHVAPPPPSATPGGSYFPPAQAGRPGSMYSASQIGAQATPPPTGPQHTHVPPPMNVQSAYTTPGTHASQPPLPAWQHAQYVPQPAGNTSIGHTQPTVTPGFQTPVRQDALSRHSQQILQPHTSYGIQPPQPYNHQAQNQYVPPQDQHGHHPSAQQGPYGQSVPPQYPVQQEVPPQPAYGQTQPSGMAQQVYNPGHQAQWQTLPQQQEGPSTLNDSWQTSHQVQGSFPVQQHEASNTTGRSNTTTPQHYNRLSPQSQPVSPIGPSQSISPGSGVHDNRGRSESIFSSISPDHRAQQPSHGTPSTTPVPSREDKSRFSALGAGGPSDWERLGGDGEEIDDEEAFGSKKEQESTVTRPPESIELPAHVPSPPSTHGWSSPAQSNPSHSRDRKSTYVPSPPSATEPSLNVTKLPTLSTIPGAAMSNESGAYQQTPTQAPAHWNSHVNEQHKAELTAKDEALERLQLDTEKEKANLEAEIGKLKVELETTKSDAVDEVSQLRAELNALKITSEQVAAELATVNAEKDATIERMKEDAEGKEHNIDERDAIIANLRGQIEAEKLKEIPKPTPADLIPDIDPWYIGSLERYIAMLRNEANEPQVEEKIKTFRAFCKAESEIRGINYYDAPPPAPSNISHMQQQLEQPVTEDLNVNIPRQPLQEDDDDYDFSPGGRPILKSFPCQAAAGRASTQSQTNASSQSTTILTPTSSVEGDASKTPVQCVAEEASQPQYKAYVPAASVADCAPLRHRSASSFSSTPVLSSSSGHSKGPDEIFFGAHNESRPKTNSRPTSSSDSPVAIPAPLKFASSRPGSIAAPSKQTPSDALRHLLPERLVPVTTSRFIDGARARFETVKSKAVSAEELTKAWEKSASLNRRKRDDARRKRQEENEEHNDDLFNNDEISYAEMNQREEAFKLEEARLKAQEDRDEYNSYVEVVFDPIFEALQVDIKTLAELRVEVESVLPTSVSGIQGMQSKDVPSPRECLELLRDIHELAERRHAAVFEAVMERDKRYKRTEVQPLYAAGQISKMKEVEKHFENAEKQAILQAKREKAERVAEFVKLTEEVVIDAVGIEQGEIDRIVTIVKEFEDGQGDAGLLGRAHDALISLKVSSKALLCLFNSLEISLNDSVLDAEIAQVQAQGGTAGRLQELENEKRAGAAKMTAEYERRIAVLEQDNDEIEQLILKKRGKTKVDEGQERGKEERLKAALEEAKRRNGQA